MFWDPIVKNPASEEGLCRIESPKFVSAFYGTRDEPRADTTAVWPMTLGSRDWCGRFEEALEPE
jgi:hypothetical protein